MLSLLFYHLDALPKLLGLLVHRSNVSLRLVKQRFILLRCCQVNAVTDVALLHVRFVHACALALFKFRDWVRLANGVEFGKAPGFLPVRCACLAAFEFDLHHLGALFVNGRVEGRLEVRPSLAREREHFLLKRLRMRFVLDDWFLVEWPDSVLVHVVRVKRGT